MGIDVSRLSPWAQQQIAQKILAQNRQKAAEEPKRKNKYNAIPTEKVVADGKKIRFDSGREASRFDELMLMLNVGEISDLKLQHDFTLQEAYTTPEGERVRAIRYKADFTYWRDGEFVVEDVKSKATKTKVYAIKKKLMAERGYQITEVE